jgi:uncharacterized protein (DUF58 family)
MAVIFYLSAWNRDINMLYAMFSLLVATLFLAYVLPRKALHEVTASHTLPAAAFEEDQIDIAVVVKNKGWRGRYMIEVIDSIPAAEPALQKPMSFIARLKGGETLKFTIPFQCYKRGEYAIGPMVLRSAYPLGISAIESVIPEEQPKLIVYPKIFEISHLPFLSVTNMPSSSAEAVAKAGGSEEFFGTREYHHGDSIKYIHWRSTAKYSKLIVKEFEMRCTSEITFILDLHRESSVGTGRESTLEYSVKIAASMAKYVLEHGNTVQLIGFGERLHMLPYSRGMDKLHHVLDMLARVNDDGRIAYPRAIDQSVNYLRDGGQVVLFIRSSALADDYVYVLGLLKSKRIKPMAIFYDEESFRYNHQNKTRWDKHRLAQEFIVNSCPVYFITKETPLTEVFC